MVASSLQNLPVLHWRRATLALAGSLLAHALLLGFSGGGPAARLMRPASALHAELKTVLPGPQPAGVERADTLGTTAPPRLETPGLPERRAAARSEPATAPSPTPASAAGSADSRVYSARELDRFPQPLQPLPRTQGGSLRLWLTIDARGHVVDLAAGGEALPDPSWRERLSGVMFSPALREDRPVKARILLELGE